jgi:hypothetical protein
MNAKAFVPDLSTGWLRSLQSNRFKERSKDMHLNMIAEILVAGRSRLMTKCLPTAARACTLANVNGKLKSSLQDLDRS